jgi:hypothetical protein
MGGRAQRDNLVVGRHASVGYGIDRGKSPNVLDLDDDDFQRGGSDDTEYMLSNLLAELTAQLTHLRTQVRNIVPLTTRTPTDPRVCVDRKRGVGQR